MFEGEVGVIRGILQPRNLEIHPAWASNKSTRWGLKSCSSDDNDDDRNVLV